MFIITRLFLCLFISLFFTSCFSQVSKTVKTNFNAFPVNKKLEGKRLLKINRLHPDNIDLYHDSILCIVDGTGRQSHHFALYNLSQSSFLSPAMAVGSKAGQALSFLSYGIEKQYVWAYDINKEKIIFSGLDNAWNNNHSRKELPVPGFYYSVQLLNDTTLLASGDYYSDHDNYKVSIINLVTGKTVRQLVPYSDNPSKPYTRAQKMAEESFLFVKPTKDKCVLACRYTDRIEIIDLHSGKSTVVQGPEGLSPEMVEMTGSDGQKISTRGADTRYAFVGGEVTNHFIYLLYSGNRDGTIHRFYGKYIYVYDWNGKPLQRLELKNDTKDFAVTGNDSLLYTYNPRSKYISVAKIKK